MNFFAHQEHARAQTRRMLILFALAVIAIVLAIDCVIFLGFGLDSAVHGAGAGVSAGPLIAVSAAVLALIGLASMYRVASLRGGGAAIAQQFGAVLVPPDTGNFAYRRLRNVIEEIAIASGVPVPEIYVIEDESAINAFAAGYTPADAAVTVTRGCLDKLTRDELQGVIAHEFSHVLNGDMRLSIRLIGLVFGILVVSIIGRKIAFSGSYSRSRSSGGAVMFGIALLVVGSIGVFFARLIKAAISRQREYLADASAVQFTRQTEGIAGALKKIGGLAEGSRLASKETEEVAHMLFGDGVGYSALFATHPPLVDRIRRLEPAFDPEQGFAAVAADWSDPVRVNEDDAGADVSIAGFAPARTRTVVPRAAIAPLPAADAQLQLSAPAVVHQVANPDTDDYRAAQAIHAAIPDALRRAACQQDRAMPLVFALVLNADDATRARQLAIIERHGDSGTRSLVETLANDVNALHPMQRLPLAALAFPTLRRRPRPQLQTFLIVLKQLIDADGEVSLEEYCLAKLFGVQVMEALNPAAARPIGRVKLPDVADEVADVYAIVAEHGHDDIAAAQRAYALGMNEVLPGTGRVYATPQDWASALDRALPRLDLLAPAGKELLVRGLVRSISADGTVNVNEAELLRTICAALHCPLPPLLQMTD